MIQQRFLILIFVLPFFFQSAYADNYDSTLDLFESSPQVKPFFENAYGFAVLPVVGKGGFFLGGAHGKGKVYVNDQVTGTTSVTKVSVGLQMGGQTFSEIVFFQDERAYEDFTSGTYEFDASASAVLITAGAQVQKATTGTTGSASVGSARSTEMETSYTKGMAVFIHVLGGLMYEASIGGQKFKFTPLEAEAEAEAESDT